MGSFLYIKNIYIKHKKLMKAYKTYTQYIKKNFFTFQRKDTYSDISHSYTHTHTHTY